LAFNAVLLRQFTGGRLNGLKIAHTLYFLWKHFWLPRDYTVLIDGKNNNCL